MVTHYREDQSAKRKLEDSLNGTPAKKAKMNGAKAASKSSDDSSSDESEDEKPVAKPAPKAAPGTFYKIFYSHRDKARVVSFLAGNANYTNN